MTLDEKMNRSKVVDSDHLYYFIADDIFDVIIGLKIILEVHISEFRFFEMSKQTQMEKRPKLKL